jgi:hypothetical protein
LRLANRIDIVLPSVSPFNFQITTGYLLCFALFSAQKVRHLAGFSLVGFRRYFRLTTIKESGVFLMKSRSAVALCIFILLFVGFTLTQAQTSQPEPTPTPASTESHEAHHEATTTPVPTVSATPQMGPGNMGGTGAGEDVQSMMENMSAMMDMMLGMEMSDEMRDMMLQLRDMMDMMMMGMSDDMLSDLQHMSDLIDMMLGMEMSEEMYGMMMQMRGMMDMMMSGIGIMNATATPDTMGGMDMGGGHAMEPISSEGVHPATETIGGQPLEYRLEDGVKVFEITAQPVLWNILDDVTVTAWTYNGTVPGPLIRVTEGDQVRIIFTNQLPEPTTIHWHGISVPNAMDGVPGVTQDPVQPGETFIYEFTASPAGTFMYHSHYESDVQVNIGLYAPFIIDPATPPENPPDVDVTLMFSEWRVVDGETYPAMPMSDLEPNYFTINGHAFPNTETINVQLGQRVRLRLISIGQFIHPMHLHGMAFEVVAIDGYPVPEAVQQTRDTLSVAPGERYDIEFVATAPGTWMFHCHILHHTTNDGVDPGGLMLTINVTE